MDPLFTEEQLLSLIHISWILDTMQQCVEHNVPFWFKQTGAKFKKGSRVYHIKRKDQMSQAEKAGVNYRFGSNMFNQDR